MSLPANKRKLGYIFSLYTWTTVQYRKEVQKNIPMETMRSVETIELH